MRSKKSHNPESQENEARQEIPSDQQIQKMTVSSLREVCVLNNINCSKASKKDELVRKVKEFYAT